MGIACLAFQWSGDGNELLHHAALNDSESGVRQSALRAYGFAAGEGAEELLREGAEVDPDEERVRKGEELLVKDRNRPIAKLVPLAVGEDLDSEELELAAGLIRLPAKSLPDSFWKMPAPQVSFEDAVSAVTFERDVD